MKRAGLMIALSVPLVLSAQTQPNGWPSPLPERMPERQAPLPSEQPGPPRANGPLDQYGQPVGQAPQAYPEPYPRQGPQQYPQPRPYPESPQSNVRAPRQMVLRPGSYITVRVNQPLSSDHNTQGDAFTATLEHPLIVDGFVVAQRGQTIGGRVVDAVRPGRVEGQSRLVVELTDVTLVDGQFLPLRTQYIDRAGGTSHQRDANAIAGATVLGAAIGGAAGRGVGAGIGAAAGAVLGTIGVLSTRGRETAIYPETVLTFRVMEPVTIQTARAPGAFHPATAADFPRPRPSYSQRPAPYPQQYPYGRDPYYNGR